ncbi:hypothetical protein P1P68_19835, partial [Streptomyces scabiei]|nr:hypothetical protein [Streptomyces scabiei]
AAGVLLAAAGALVAARGVVLLTRVAPAGRREPEAVATPEETYGEAYEKPREEHPVAAVLALEPRHAPAEPSLMPRRPQTPTPGHLTPL